MGLVRSLKLRKILKQTSVWEYKMDSHRFVCLHCDSLLLKNQGGHLLFYSLITRRGNHSKEYFKLKDCFLQASFVFWIDYSIIFLEFICSWSNLNLWLSLFISNKTTDFVVIKKGTRRRLKIVFKHIWTYLGPFQKGISVLIMLIKNVYLFWMFSYFAYVKINNSCLYFTSILKS